MKYIFLLLLVASCSHQSSGFFHNNAAIDSGNAAMDAGNAAAQQNMHHNPMPAPAPGF